MNELTVVPLDGYPEEIGRWLWALEETRARTLRLVEDLEQSEVDWEGPDGQENAIGSLLYHIGGVEMGWLFYDIRGLAALPDDVKQEFPFDATEAGSRRLKRVLGVPLTDHVRRLERGRDVFLNAMRGMTMDEWRRVRAEPLESKYAVSPEWVVFHLVEHEAGHALQISSLKARVRRRTASQG